MTLSKRQKQVLSLVAKGLTNKRIARRLQISPGTVKVHVSDLMRRLGARTRAQAVAISLTR